MVPVEERLDLRVHRNLKSLIGAEADKKGQTLNEAVTELVCKALRRSPADFPIPRKSPGRKREGQGEK